MKIKTAESDYEKVISFPYEKKMTEKCENCSKEKQDRVNVERFISKLDSFFKTNDLDGALKLVEYWENEARRVGDIKGLITVLNERLGLSRRVNDSKRGLSDAYELLALLEVEKSENTLSGATVMLNCATNLKAFGKADKALPYYEKVKEIYEKSLEKGDFRLSGLYNNMALTLCENGYYDKAEKTFFDAIENLKIKGENDGEIAVTYVNLAVMYRSIDDSEKAFSSMNKAYEILKSITKHDPDYAFILSKCAPAFCDFGMTDIGNEFKNLSEKIYEGN